MSEMPEDYVPSVAGEQFYSKYKVNSIWTRYKLTRVMDRHTKILYACCEGHIDPEPLCVDPTYREFERVNKQEKEMGAHPAVTQDKYIPKVGEVCEFNRNRLSPSEWLKGGDK